MNTATRAELNEVAKASKARDIASKAIASTSRRAAATTRNRREVESFEAKGQEDGFLDEDGFFTQSADEFMAETGLSFNSTDIMGLGY